MKQHLLALLALTSASGLSAAADAGPADDIELEAVHTAGTSSACAYKAASITFVYLLRVLNDFGKTVIVSPDSKRHKPFVIRKDTPGSQGEPNYSTSILDTLFALYCPKYFHRKASFILKLLRQNPSAVVACQFNEKQSIIRIDTLPFDDAAYDAYKAEHLEQNPPITGFDLDRMGQWYACWGEEKVRKMTPSSSCSLKMHNAYRDAIQRRYMSKTITPGRNPIDGAALALHITRRTTGFFKPEPIAIESIDDYPFQLSTVAHIPMEYSNTKLGLADLRRRLPLDQKAIETIVAQLVDNPNQSIVLYLDPESQPLGQATYDAPPKDKEIKNNLTKYPIISVARQNRVNQYDRDLGHYHSTETVYCGNYELGCLKHYLPRSEWTGECRIQAIEIKTIGADLSNQVNAEQERHS